MAPFDRAPHTGRSPNTKILSEIPDRTVVPVRSTHFTSPVGPHCSPEPCCTAATISSIACSAPDQGVVQRSCDQEHNGLPSPKPEQTCLVCDHRGHESCSGGHPCVAHVAFPGRPSGSGFGNGERGCIWAVQFSRLSTSGIHER